MVGDSVLDALRGEVGLDPHAVVAAVVGDAPLLPEGFADVGTTLLVHREGDRVCHVGLGGKQLDEKALGHAEGRPGLRRLVRGGRNARRLGRGRGIDAGYPAGRGCRRK